MYIKTRDLVVIISSSHYYNKINTHDANVQNTHLKTVCDVH